jgi:HPt (histidine-containing phosphotransfer) domain-containing protein
MSQSKLSKLLDPETLNTLRELASEDDPEFFGKLLVLFSDSIPTKLNQIKKAFDQKDGPLLTAEAHSLKSSCFNVGAEKMGEMSRLLESIGKSNPLVLDQSLYIELDQTAHLTRNEIENLPEVIHFRSQAK